MLPDATQRLRIIAVLALVMAPHVLHFPPWISLFAAVVLGWQALAIRRGWPQPGRLLRMALAGAAFVGVYLSFGQIDGRNAGAALLTLLLTLKLTEIRNHRDVMVLLSLCFFLLITHFLYSQAIGMLIFLAAGMVLITACLIDASHPQGALPSNRLAAHSARLLLQAIPVAALLFVLFPRIPGPLWGIPAPSGAARTGLSETMAPGAISRVARSDEVVFRVRFQGQVPAPAQRYWRGPVFWAFDGTQWSRGHPQRFMPSPDRHFEGQPVRYRLTMEPHHQDWLLALDLPFNTPDSTHLDAAGTLRTSDPIDERASYRLVSYPDYRLQVSAPEALLAYARRLPATGNPRARALARQWASHLTPQGVVNAALRRFRQQPYVYTLEPVPVSGINHIDQFLFATREGFCAHYAGAFTFLMRAAGIPARVVTGYQGGQFGIGDDYMVVRAASAHAWSEVWLAGQGWRRVDPTAAVSPARVESGLAASMTGDEPVPYLARGVGELWYQLAMSWDYVNAAWNRWFLAYGPSLQSSFMQYLGLPDTRAMILALTILVSAFLAALGLLLARQTRPPRPGDPVQAAWLTICRRLARVDMVRSPAEGPLDFARRAAATRPEDAAVIVDLAQRYARLRYRGGSPQQRERFVRMARDYRPRRTRRPPAQ